MRQDRGRVSLKEHIRRRYEEELQYLHGEIDYLREIKHERHEYMIQQRKKRIKEIKEKMKQ